jgi:tetratricopeptide (TPR) repeat protein
VPAPGPHSAVSPKFLLHRAQYLLANGRLSEACAAAKAAQEIGAADPILLDAVGTIYSRANEQALAKSAYDQALELTPSNPQILFNRAAVRRFLGDFTGAETDYDRVIALNPTDYEAYKNRSDLRTQTDASNHVAELERVISQGVPDWRGEVQLRHALSKEYEDLGQYDAAFKHLHRGTKLRRDHIRYDVRTDVATVDWIMDAYPATATRIHFETSEASPIFIVGLPRSGSTLVDRILGSHPNVSSAGELNCFALALVAAVRRQSGPSQLPRKELVTRSATVDFAALGHDYLVRARAAGAVTARFTDKMPLNYLYCGLINRALPNARIVQVKRHPMAVCHAMFKTLFEDGYPFSYDLAELAQYYIAYRRLMDHWQACLPGELYTVSYEALVADQEGETRKLLEFCRLDWDPACLDFHANPAPSTTASASQIRQRIYDTSVSQWRRYEKHLQPLADLLTAAGIDLENS